MTVTKGGSGVTLFIANCDGVFLSRHDRVSKISVSVRLKITNALQTI